MHKQNEALLLKQSEPYTWREVI